MNLTARWVSRWKPEMMKGILRPVFSTRAVRSVRTFFRRFSSAVLRRPAAARVVKDAHGNVLADGDVVAMVKDSSLVSVLGVSDITQLGKVTVQGQRIESGKLTRADARTGLDADRAKTGGIDAAGGPDLAHI